MKSVLVVLALVGVVSVSGSISIEELTDLSDTVQGDLHALAMEMSDARTLCAVGDEYLNEIYDFFVPKMDTINKEQYALIDKYQAQVKSMQHRVDEAKSQETGSITLAKATQASLTRMFDYVNGSKVKDVTDSQMMQIVELKGYAAEVKADFLLYLNESLENLNEQDEDFHVKLDLLEDAVENRKCEYGFKFLEVQDNNRVDLKTPFDVTPNVTVSMTGFVAYTDLYAHGNHDVLAPKIEVSSVAADRFYVNVVDNSDGRVQLKYVSVSWMACQYLDAKVDLFY